MEVLQLAKKLAGPFTTAALCDNDEQGSALVGNPQARLQELNPGCIDRTGRSEGFRSGGAGAPLDDHHFRRFAQAAIAGGREGKA